MNGFNRPTKEQVRNYLTKRFFAETPPPGPEQIKTELGIEIRVDQQKIRQANSQQCI